MIGHLYISSISYEEILLSVNEHFYLKNYRKILYIYIHVLSYINPNFIFLFLNIFDNYFTFILCL